MCQKRSVPRGRFWEGNLNPHRRAPFARRICMIRLSSANSSSLRPERREDLLEIKPSGNDRHVRSKPVFAVGHSLVNVLGDIARSLAEASARRRARSTSMPCLMPDVVADCLCEGRDVRRQLSPTLTTSSSSSAFDASQSISTRVLGESPLPHVARRRDLQGRVQGGGTAKDGRRSASHGVARTLHIGPTPSSLSDSGLGLFEVRPHGLHPGAASRNFLKKRLFPIGSPTERSR